MKQDNVKKVCDLVLEFGSNLYPLLMDLKRDDHFPEMSKTFSFKSGHRLAVAELTLIAVEEVANYLQESSDECISEGPWYFFNRLNVPFSMRRKGVAKKLLTQVIEWADKKGYNILNVINPYGDLNMRQLTNLYEDYGFEEIERGFMVRTPFMEKPCYDDIEEDEEEVADAKAEMRKRMLEEEEKPVFGRKTKSSPDKEDDDEDSDCEDRSGRDTSRMKSIKRVKVDSSMIKKDNLPKRCRLDSSEKIKCSIKNMYDEDGNCMECDKEDFIKDQERYVHEQERVMSQNEER